MPTEETTNPEEAPTTAIAQSLGMQSDVSLYNQVTYNQMYAIATLMAMGDNSIPNTFKGNVADCMAIVVKAKGWGVNPYSVIDKCYVIKGKVSYESQLIVAVINAFAPIKERLHLEWFGPWENVVGKLKIMSGQNGKYAVPDWSLEDEEGCGIRVSATIKGESKPRPLELLLKQCHPRNSTLWANDPKQQIAYLSQRRWSNLHTPDVIMGMYTREELSSSQDWDMTVESLPTSVEGDPETQTQVDVKVEAEPEAEASKKSMDKIEELLRSEFIPKETKEKYEEALTANSPTEAEAMVSIARLTRHIRKAEKASKDTTGDVMTHMHALGREVYGDKWDAERTNLVNGVNQLKTSSKELTEAEIREVISRLELIKSENPEKK